MYLSRSDLRTNAFHVRPFLNQTENRVTMASDVFLGLEGYVALDARLDCRERMPHPDAFELP